MLPSVKEELIFWKDDVRCLNGRPISRQFPVHVQLFILMRVMFVPGESLRASMVSFVTSLRPPTKRDAALPGASFRRSMFAFLLFLKHYPVVQCSGLLITVISLPSFAVVA